MSPVARPGAPLRHLILAAALLVAGCGSSPEGTVSGMTEADGYTFALLGEGNVMTRSGGSGLSVTLGEHVIGVDGGKLTFDGKDAGTVAKGDRVTVDARGRLFVNGKAR